MDYEITAAEVKGKLDAGESFTLLDVREPWEFETAKISSAKLTCRWAKYRRGHTRNWIPRTTSWSSAITAFDR